MNPKPFFLKNAPSLIERAWPAQKISVESYKEQKAGAGKTLTALGSYWKGRKPLVLNRACILGALLPAGEDLEKDLEIFEMLMGMDEPSMRKRLKNKKADPKTFREWVEHSERAENCEPEELHAHIWDRVNQYLSTSAQSIPELIEQLGIMRFGHRPKVCDPFCGSGQIPFEAARMGCDVYASDLNPIACMLTWGSLHIVGASQERRKKLLKARNGLIDRVRSEMDGLNFETNGKGRKAKVYLYCCECICPVTGWRVPMMPSFVISEKRCIVTRLAPDVKKRRYEIEILSGVSEKEMAEAKKGTIQGNLLIHPKLEGRSAATVASIRGDFKNEKRDNRNRLRRWTKTDVVFKEDDIFQERLYCIQWQNENGSTEFCSVTEQDLQREEAVIHYVKKHLEEWQAKGWVPNDEIKVGCKTDEPIRTRGWTHWHHLFNPRQLLLLTFVNKYADATGKIGLGHLLNYNSRLCSWQSDFDQSRNVFSNQALNTLFNYGCRSSLYALPMLKTEYKSFPFFQHSSLKVENHSADIIPGNHDIIITDPPYGDAVMYEEITEFFIAWLRRNPPKERKFQGDLSKIHT